MRIGSYEASTILSKCSKANPKPKTHVLDRIESLRNVLRLYNSDKLSCHAYEWFASQYLLSLDMLERDTKESRKLCSIAL
jgi:hypothetical protein